MRSRQAHESAAGPGAGGPGRAVPGAGASRSVTSSLLLPAVLAIALSGCDKKTSQAPSQPAGQQPVPTVIVAEAQRQPIAESVEFVGRVEALEKVEIRARVTGFLGERHFREGQIVNEGDLLFVIEREPFEAEVGQKQARVESAQAQLTFANFQVERARELLRTNTTPRATYDQRVAEQGMAAASVSGAQADLRLAEVNLSYTAIRSPISGRIGRASITRGNVVSPDAGVLTVVVRQDPIRVTFPVSQRQLLDLRRKYQGQGPDAVRVRVRLPDGSQYAQTGRVNFIDVQTDRTTDTALAQAQIANPDGLLSDGQFIGISVEGEEPQQVVVIPQSAVQIDQTGPFVLVVGDGNKVEQRRVRLGRGPAGQSVIESGLDAGAMVITEGAQRARPGAVVAPRPAADVPAGGPVPPPAG